MATYVVTSKANPSVEVYRYNSDTGPVEWNEMSFALFDHTLFDDGIPEPEPIPSEWYINIGPFFDRFGSQKIFILASSDPIVRALVTDCQIRKYIDLVGRRADVEGAIDTLIAKGFTLDKAKIMDVKPTKDEVYNG